MSRAAFIAGLFLGTVAGILLWPFLVFWRSGAEPDEPATDVELIVDGIVRRYGSALNRLAEYDGEAIGV